MVKVLQISVQMQDDEFANFLQHLASRGVIGAADPVTGQIADDDNAPLNANAPQVDSTGVPWIEAVHSANKSINPSDGTWRGKRGVDKPTRQAYENQARQVAAGAAQPSAQVPAGAIPPVPAAVQPLPVGGVPPIAPAAMFPAAGGFPPVAPAPVDQPVTYQAVLDKFQAAVAGSRMQANDFATWYPELGINDPAQLMTNESARVKAMHKLRVVMGEVAA